MRDLVALLPFAIAQIPVSNDTWERLGFGILGIATTVYLFKLMQAKDEKRQTKAEADEKEFRNSVIKAAEEEKADRKIREDAAAAERNRLLEENNRLNSQVVTILMETNAKMIQQGKDFKTAIEDGQRSIKELIRTYNTPSSRKVEITNNQDHPVPTSNVD